MGFRARPTKTHIIWTRGGRSGGSKKRFDKRCFERWANHHGFDFETTKRADHDRANEVRGQCRCVFSWGTTTGRSFEFGDEQWEMGSQRAPRTFVEIDECGVGRIQGWRSEAICDIVEMRFSGPTLLVKSRAGERKRIDGSELARPPTGHREDDS